MKNKKSKIIVPALGLILLSTAASISGSVAWFTANRTVEVQANHFEVKRLGGNLSCVVGTFGTNDADAYGAHKASNQAMEVPATNYMLNSSYDHTHGSLFYTENGTSFTEHSGDTNWKHTTNTGDYYYAIKWKMTFTYQFGDDNTTQDLFFDKDSTFTYSSGENLQTYKGFRMCFENNTEKVIWAPQQTEGTDPNYNCTFMQGAVGATTPTTANYAASGNGDLIASDTSENVVLQASAAAANDNTKKNYLGSFTGAANSTQTIVVTAIAWFEGTDANVVNEATLSEVSATLNFFVHDRAQ